MKPNQEKIDRDYTDCWYCDNVIAYPGYVMLLYLGYPKIKVMIKEEKYYSTDFEFMDFYDKNIVNIEFLNDPDDSLDVVAVESALTKLWNFSVDHEAIDEETTQNFIDEYLDEE